MAKKRTKAPQHKVKIKPENYVKKNGRKLPIHECLVSDDWEERGMAVVIVARKKANGQIVGAGYVLDTFCLGLKQSALYYNMQMMDYEELIQTQEQRMDFKFSKVEPGYAFNLVYGAVEYAEDIGFNPAKDFKVTEYILPPADSIEFIDFKFGREGKPFYVAGPYDDMERIINTLDANLGLGNYDFVLPPDMYDDEEDFYDEEEEANEVKDYNFTRVFSGLDEDEIYPFSDKEYKKEIESLDGEFVGLKLDTQLAEIYDASTEKGSITLHEDLKAEIAAQFLAKVQAENADNEEVMSLISSEEAIKAFNARSYYGVESYERFYASDNGADISLRDYILSAYIQLM